MALLWFDGFDRYGDGVGYPYQTEPTGIMSGRYKLAEDGDIALKVCAGRVGGYSIAIAYDTSHWFQTPHLTTDRTLIIGFSMRQPIAQAGKFLQFKTINNYYVGVQLQINADGSLSLYSGWNLLGTTDAGVISWGTWYFVQLKVYCDDSAGTYELRVNNAVELQGVADTKDDPNNNYYAAIRFQSINPDVDKNPRIDDFWMCDSTSAVCNDFLGPGQVVTTLIPSSEGDSSDWDVTPGPNHYEAVDELKQDDSEYVESTVTDDLDLYNYESPPAMCEIKGVQIHSEAKITGTEEKILKTVIKHATTEDADAGVSVGTSDYLTFTRLMLINPVTSLDWVRGDIDNLQAGVKVG